MERITRVVMAPIEERGIALVEEFDILVHKAKHSKEFKTYEK